MENFFTNAFSNCSDADKESFYKTVFLNDPSDYAKELRKTYYAGILKHMGENVEIGTNVKFVNPQYISIGNNVQIGDDVTLIARGPGGITIEDNCYIQERVYLDTEIKDEGYILIKHDTYIGVGCTFFGHAGLEIGDNTLIAQNVTLTPYSHKYENPSDLIWNQGGHYKKVVIGRDVYIGMGVCIMYTGDIGDGCVIGAGTTVVKPIPPYSVAVGCPAKVIKERK